MDKPLTGIEAVLGITGGIAAYKSAELVRLMRDAGAGVSVVMTRAAERFVTPLTFSVLAGRPALTSLFDDAAGGISHIELTSRADIFVVAPATANVIGKMACGIADDLLTTALLAARCPVLMAPAMNCRMYDSPALRRNIETLKGFGVRFVGPDEGPMACGEYGWGRMSEPADILEAAVPLAAKGRELAGRKVVVTAGPTIEDIDPVRFISNRSTGKMGYAVAREAAARGADVTLISGPSCLEPPFGVELIRVRDAYGMEEAVNAASGKADVVIMAAAVSDYRPESAADRKIKKAAGELSIPLAGNPDILKGLAGKKPKGQVLVGFAAETEDVEKNAMGKLRDKKLDIIAANQVGGDTGFESDYNVIKIYGPKGLLLDTGRVTKGAAARALMDCVISAMRIYP